jgi:hypothetical protein
VGKNVFAQQSATVARFALHCLPAFAKDQGDDDQCRSGISPPDVRDFGSHRDFTRKKRIKVRSDIMGKPSARLFAALLVWVVVVLGNAQA